MSRRKQSNPKPFKHLEDQEDSAASSITGTDRRSPLGAVPLPPPGAKSAASPRSRSASADSREAGATRSALSSSTPPHRPSRDSVPPPPPLTKIHSSKTSLASIATATDDSDDNEIVQQLQAKLDDRYCRDCEIQFKSFKTFKVHKQLYCGSRHAGSKVMFSTSSPAPAGIPSSKNRPKSSPSLNNNNHSNNGSHQPRVNKAAPNGFDSELSSALCSARQNCADVAAAMSVPLSTGLVAAVSSHASIPLQVLAAGLSPSSSPSQPGSLTLMSPSLLLNQPIFVAISTNPLILVPCSYNATTGGLNFANTSQPVLGHPSLVSAGGQDAGVAASVAAHRPLVLKSSRALSPSLNPSSPNNHNASSNHSNHSGSALSPGVESEQPLDLTSKSNLPKDVPLEEVVKNITLANQNSIANDASASRIRRRRNSNAIVIAPGSSFLNKPPHQQSYAHLDQDATTDDNNSRSSCCSPPQVHSLSLPIPGHPLPGQLSLVGPASCSSLPISAVERQGLVKKGTFRCKDCNIVFYKHENFLVHKSMYCASRRSSDHNNVSSPSPEPPESDHAPNSSPDVTLDSKPALGHASPNRSVTSTPPLTSPPPLVQHHQPVFQFFCVACGIRFTSLDTLHAHQAFYCLKRSVSSQAKGGAEESSAVSMNGDSKAPAEDSSETGPGPASSASAAAPAKSCHSHSNLQAFKCSICGYKGHTMRGMRTHVRIHQDKMQGLSEESFIEYIEDAAADRKTATSGSRSRRRSLEPSAVQDRQSAPSPPAKRRRQAIPCLRYN